MRHDPVRSNARRVTLPQMNHSQPQLTCLPQVWKYLDQARQDQLAQLLAELIRRIHRPAGRKEDANE